MNRKPSGQQWKPMKLMLESVAKKMPPLGEYLGDDPLVYVRLFGLGGLGHVDWYVVAYDPESRIALAYVTNGQSDEFEYVSLDELESLNPLKDRMTWVERDRYVDLPKPLSKLVGRSHPKSRELTSLMRRTKRSAKKRTA